ncbi:MAG: hypothetical protein IH586_08805 [Anaerolineaceae bacterium]|nr:hypothetical protein [Anaerolineaceae bacterium]
MSTDFVVAAQMSSQLQAQDRRYIARIIDQVRQAVAAAGIDILCVGGAEVPELYYALTEIPRKAAPQVYLWVPILSDFTSMRPEFRTINFQGNPSQGWRGSERWEEVGENFIFACPNNPAACSSTIATLERLLTEYSFDGVFLDKIRFPSTANGFAELLSCFCPHCLAAAAKQGLDLTAVQAMLNRMPKQKHWQEMSEVNLPQAAWLAALLGMLPSSDQDLLLRFLGFRAQAITRLVKAIQALAVRKHLRLALDLFSPGLAYLVGQDYLELANLAAWVKPMSYRYASGPAGLRLEIPELARGLEQYLRLAPEVAERWLWAAVPELSGVRLSDLVQDGAPLELIAAESRRAATWLGSTPLYMGVEAVSIPAYRVEVHPSEVRQLVEIARESGAHGIVLSWDLLQIPEENLLAIRL